MRRANTPNQDNNTYDDIVAAYYIVSAYGDFSYFEHMHSNGRKALNEYYNLKDHNNFKNITLCKICAKTGARIILTIND